MTATVERQYRLVTSTHSSSAIRAALTAAHYRVIDPHDNSVTGVDGSEWDRLTSASTGDVSVRPPGRSGGGIEYTWQGDKLYLEVQEGDAG